MSRNRRYALSFVVFLLLLILAALAAWQKASAQGTQFDCTVEGTASGGFVLRCEPQAAVTPTETPTLIPTATEVAATATAVPTAIPTATATTVLTATATPTAVPSATPTLGPQPLGPNWGGNVDGFFIEGDRLHTATGGAVLWQERFGLPQEVYVTLAQIDPAGGGVALILLSQSPTDPTQGAMAVHYVAGRLAILTSYAGKWATARSDIPVVFHPGDQFGARVQGNSLTVYRNGQLVHTEQMPTITAWLTGSGYIGLASVGNNVFEDFGGGTLPAGTGQ